MANLHCVEALLVSSLQSLSKIAKAVSAVLLLHSLGKVAKSEYVMSSLEVSLSLEPIVVLM